MKKVNFIIVICISGIFMLATSVSNAQLKNFKNEKGLIGFKNSSGSVVIEPKYNEVKENGMFREGLLAVSANGKWGAIDYNGKEVIAIKYDEIAPHFSDGISQAKLDGKWGWLNKDGSTFVPFKFDVTKFFKENRAAVKLNNKWAYIDMTGKEITPYKYDYADVFFNGYSYVGVNGLYGFIDSTGKEITPLKYGFVLSFKKGADVAVVALNNKWGFIDKAGKETLKYDNIEYYSDDYSQAFLKGKRGLLSTKTGIEVVPPKYTYISPVNRDGFAVVNIGANASVMGGKWGLIDTTWKEVLPLIYDEIPSNRFSEGLLLAKLKGKYGYLDKTCKVAIPFIFDKASSTFYGGKAEVTIGKRTFNINKYGEEVK